MTCWKRGGKTLARMNTRRTLCEKRSGASRLRKHRGDEGRCKISKIQILQFKRQVTQLEHRAIGPRIRGWEDDPGITG